MTRRNCDDHLSQWAREKAAREKARNPARTIQMRKRQAPPRRQSVVKGGDIEAAAFSPGFYASGSCLSVLHNAVVAWNMIQIGDIVGQLRADGHEINDETLSHVTPLLRKHINPFGRYHFDLDRMRKPSASSAAIP